MDDLVIARGKRRSVCGLIDAENPRLPTGTPGKLGISLCTQTPRPLPMQLASRATLRLIGRREPRKQIGVRELENDDTASTCTNASARVTSN